MKQCSAMLHSPLLPSPENSQPKMAQPGTKKVIRMTVSLFLTGALVANRAVATGAMAVECDEPARQARFLQPTKSRENYELHQKALMYRPPSARPIRPQSARPRADSVPTAGSDTSTQSHAQARIYVPRPPPAAPPGPPPDNTRRARPASANVAPRGSSSGDVASLRQVYVPQVAVAMAAAAAQAAAAAAAAQQQSGTQPARRDEDNTPNFVSKVAYPVYRRTVISATPAASVSAAHSQQELQHEQQQQQPKQRSAVRPRSAATHRSSDAAAATAGSHSGSSSAAASAASPDRRRERSGRVGVTSRPQSARPRRAHNMDAAAAAAHKLSGSTSAAYSFTGISSAAASSVNSKQYAQQQQQQQQQQHRPPPYQPHAYKQRRESVESMMARIFQQKLNQLQGSTASSADTAVVTATAGVTAASVPSSTIKASPHWTVSSAAAPATSAATAATVAAMTSAKRSDSVGSAASAQTVVRSAVVPNSSQHSSSHAQQQQHKRVRPASACESGRGGSVGAGGGLYARLFRKGQVGYRGSKCTAVILQYCVAVYM
jgi:trimeric autotransporter adhesin